MEDLESKISDILSDPDAMAGILSMAKSLGLGASEPTETPPPADQDNAIPDTVAGLLSAAGHLNGKQAALLQALRPFLKESRRRKIDRAMQAARISRIAGYAIQHLGPSDQGR